MGVGTGGGYGPGGHVPRKSGGRRPGLSIQEGKRHPGSQAAQDALRVELEQARALLEAAKAQANEKSEAHADQLDALKVLAKSRGEHEDAKSALEKQEVKMQSEEASCGDAEAEEAKGAGLLAQISTQGGGGDCREAARKGSAGGEEQECRNAAVARSRTDQSAGRKRKPSASCQGRQTSHRRYGRCHGCTGSIARTPAGAQYESGAGCCPRGCRRSG